MVAQIFRPDTSENRVNLPLVIALLPLDVPIENLQLPHRGALYQEANALVPLPFKILRRKCHDHDSNPHSGD